MAPEPDSMRNEAQEMSAQESPRRTAPLHPQAASRLSALVVIALFIAYAVPGLVGHDPWKPDEPYTFGIVHHMLTSGDWIVPMTGGEPFVEKPPLYYWVSWATALLASPWLALHDGARLSSALFLLVSVASIGAAARLCWGEGTAGVAALLMLGTLGLESHAQRMQVDIALMAGFSLSILGFSACIRAKAWASVVLGLGVGMGFLAKGLIAPAVIAITALLLPVFFRPWRSRYYFVRLAVASAVALPALLIWPIALFDRSQSLFVEWLWDNNLGRYLGFSVTWLGAAYEPGSWSGTLPWFLFPLWIYALGAVAQERGRLLQQPGMQIGLTMTLVAAIVLATSASMRAVYILPLIPPLVLVAVAKLRTPQGGAGKALGALAIFIGAAAIVVVWGVWAALVFTGEVPAWRPITRTFPLPFTMPVLIPAVTGAALLSAGFVWLVWKRHRLAAAGLTLWVAALALTWGLA